MEYNLKNKIIGLVLPNTPAYSETFFRNKIKELQAQGAQVILFVSGTTKDSSVSCEVVKAPLLNRSKWIDLRLSIQILLSALLFNLSVTRRYMKIQKNNHVPLLQRVKNLIANHHILKFQLDWLHFGFGTMAVNREEVAQAIGARMAVSFRGYDLYVYPVKHKHVYDKLWNMEVNYHVLSESMKKILLSKGVDEDKIQVITPAIDLNLFKKSSKPSSDQSSLRIISVARLHWIKGLHYVLDALSIVKEVNEAFHFTIIGIGKEEERLKFAVYQLGLQNHVSFLDRLEPKEVSEMLSSSDLYLQYSLQEGFCNAVIEAQAMGLPCLVSDADGLKENIVDNETGWVVPKRNPSLLAQKILEVAAMKIEERNKFSEAAIRRVHEQFDIKDQTEKFVDFYKS